MLAAMIMNCNVSSYQTTGKQIQENVFFNVIIFLNGVKNVMIVTVHAKLEF